MNLLLFQKRWVHFLNIVFHVFLCVLVPCAIFLLISALMEEHANAQELYPPQGQEGVSAMGELELLSLPSDAYVFINGYEEGRTDSIIPDVNVGQYLVSFQLGGKVLHGVFYVYKDERLKLLADFAKGEIINITEEVMKVRSDVADIVTRLIDRSGCACLKDYYRYDVLDDFSGMLESWSKGDTISDSVDCEQSGIKAGEKIQCNIRMKYFYFTTNSKMTCSIGMETFTEAGTKTDSERYLSPLYTIPQVIRTELYMLRNEAQY